MDYNEEDYNAYLPKRSDTIYQEIERFEEYELTQCVAYEMAVRNNDIINFSINYFNSYNQRKQLYDTNNFDNLFEKFLIIDYNFFDNYFIDEELIESLLIRKHILKSDDEEIQEIKNKFNSLSEKQKLSNEGKELKLMLLRIIEKHPQFIATKQNAKYYDKKSILVEKGSFKSYKKVTNDTYFINNFYHHDEIEIERFAKIMLKRPKLQIPEKYNKAYIDININLSLPIEELQAYVKKIKDTYDKDNSHTRTTIELLGEELQKAIKTKNYPKKPKAEKMADIFFIYDYVKARQNKIKELNADEELRYKDELQRITNDKDLSTKEKKIQKATHKAEYLASIIDTKITDIFKEKAILNQLNMSSENISKMYYAIKPYIDDCRYKELITGVSTL